MVLEGAKRCFQRILDSGVIIPEFTSDRHTGIAKWVREQHPEVAHYFDIWHLARSIGKKIAKAGKEKRCEILLEWLEGIRNHLYWCATYSFFKSTNLVGLVANLHYFDI